MRRTFTLATIVALSFTLIPSFTTTASAHARRYRECRYQTSDGHMGWSESDIHRTERCALAHWPAPGGFTTAHYISERESSDTSGAVNSWSKACGTYQSLPNYWPSRVRWLAHVTGWHVSSWCLNARSNILWAIRYAHQYGWGPWGM